MLLIEFKTGEWTECEPIAPGKVKGYGDIRFLRTNAYTVRKGKVYRNIVPFGDEFATTTGLILKLEGKVKYGKTD